MANSKAQAAKEKGNVAFKAGDYPTAIGHYTSAILADRVDTTYPLNRAAAYLKLGKAEDAERDCNTVLGLNSKNVKALFRRGQSRVGMNKLLEASKDFSDVLLLEPSNASAQEELKKVNNLIQVEKAKKAKSKSPAEAMIASLNSGATNQRRRVPIKIIDPSQPAASTSLKSPAKKGTAGPDVKPVVPKEATATGDKPNALEAVSSRPLKPEAPPVPPAFSAAAAALKPEPAPNTESDPAPKVPNFKDAKQARETAKPSRMGGGIFRASGKNTVFPTREGTAASKSDTDVHAESVTSQPSRAAQAPANKALESPTPSAAKNSAAASISEVVKAPATLFEFNKAWFKASSPEARWRIIDTMSPTQFPGFCQNSMEPELLSSILEVFVNVLSTGDDRVKATVRAFMENFPKIARFSTLVLFFSRAEKALAKRVWELLGVETPTGAWSPVA